LDGTGGWPAEDLDRLALAGAMRWAVPREFGGDDLPALDLHLRYEAVARSSLTLALILSQRDSAVAIVDAARQCPLRAELLPALARHERFTTVGIAQLTTSHQRGGPALRATRTDGGYRIDGLIPWSTGAAAATWIVAGAVIEDGRQLLFLLPMSDPGVTAGPPLPLVALRESWTGRVKCDHVIIDDRLVLKGPGPKVMAGRKKSLPLGQAFLALGLCRGALDLIGEHPAPAAARAAERFRGQLDRLRAEVVGLSADGREADATAAGPRARGECNDLAVRMTYAAVALYKGGALVVPHPAQRLAREAMFLLVWSCPDPVIDCTIDLLSDG
jgi:alkylation response protein AidB-like acyl-CoA dehydrogenase